MPDSPALPLPAPSPLGALRLAAADIKLAHSVFALPFALLGAFLARQAPIGAAPVTADAAAVGGPAALAASSPWPTFAGQLALVVLCMVLARTWAMLVNRLADADFDAANPRTARRAVASGRLPRRSAALIAVLCAAAFTAAAAAFWLFFANFWPLALALPVLAWLALYSFAKRFTALCHLLLGTALAISPLAAALAIRPAALTDTPALYWLAAMVTTWVAGFDTIYALQDTDFDQQRKLFSIPSRLGVPAALWISRLLHLTAAAALFMAALADPRLNGPPFLLAVVLATLLLIAEHAVLARRGKAGLDMAFFTLNGIVSCVVGGLGVVALLIA